MRLKAGLIFPILFTPLAFGTVHTESIAIMELVILVLFSAWLLGMVRRGELRMIRAPIGLPLGGLLGGLLAAWLLWRLFKDLLLCHLLGLGRGVGHREAVNPEEGAPDPTLDRRACPGLDPGSRPSWSGRWAGQEIASA